MTRLQYIFIDTQILKQNHIPQIGMSETEFEKPNDLNTLMQIFEYMHIVTT